jgi:hypothetical protein
VVEGRQPCLLAPRIESAFPPILFWPATAQACGKVGVWPKQIGGRSRLGLALRSTVVSA